MAKVNRIVASVVSADLATLDAIAEMSDFKPANPDYKAAALDALRQDMLTKQSEDAAAQRAAAAARDDAAAAERVFHEAIVGAKLAVKAQYGKDANEVQAIGLKKSSEIRRGRRAPDTTNKSA